MTPLDYIFWAAEAILEFAGYNLAFKRRVWPLTAYLGFRFTADLGCFFVFFHYGQNAFYWADWWQRAIQYPLMAVLLAYVIGTILADVSSVKRYALFFGVFAAVGIGYAFSSAKLTSQMLIKQELSANMFLCGMLCLALAMRKEVKAPWGAISAGILLQVGSEAVLTLALLGVPHAEESYWWIKQAPLRWMADHAAHSWNLLAGIHLIDPARLYPLGAIAALGMWAWAVRPKYQLNEARLGIGARGFGR